MKPLAIVLLSLLLSYIVIWLPFQQNLESVLGWNLNFKDGIQVVWRNFDGPNYLIIAKTWYDKTLIREKFSNPLPLEYYPAHLPLYPAIIYILDTVLPGPWAMLLATFIGSFLMFGMFYLYLNEFKITKQSLWLTLILLWLPARFLAVRSIGSPEPWFVFFILASLYAFRKEKYFLAGIWGALAQLTKSPGILLFGGYLLFLLAPMIKNKRLEIKSLQKTWPLFLIPLSSLALFFFYQIKVGDFWAYFKSGDNFHLFWPPFSIFTPKGKFWTGDFWLEEIIWLWLIYGLGVLKLFKKGFKVEANFSLVFFLSTLFIAHRDIARYILPIAPLVLIGWKDVVINKEFKWLAILLIIPSLLFTWQFLLNNQSPTADWSPYL